MDLKAGTRLNISHGIGKSSRILDRVKKLCVCFEHTEFSQGKASESQAGYDPKLLKSCPLGSSISNTQESCDTKEKKASHLN